MTPSLLKFGMNLWPPFLFTGIHITDISADWRYARVELRMRPWNRNYVGTHFGGSLFAMTDPFWMLLVMHTLGRDYFVWDKAGQIEFLKPGRGTVVAEFQLSDPALATIRSATADGQKYLHWFEMDLTDAQGEAVAHLRKQLYVRLKPQARGAAPGRAAPAPDPAPTGQGND